MEKINFFRLAGQEIMGSLNVYCKSSKKCMFSEDRNRDVHCQSNIDLVPQPVYEPKRSGFGESGPQAATGGAE